MVEQGSDRIGKFWQLTGHDATKCQICKKSGAVIQYRGKITLPSYVLKAPSLLIRNKKTGKLIRTIGINCGCYSKVHRQISYIQAGQMDD